MKKIRSQTISTKILFTLLLMAMTLLFMGSISATSIGSDFILPDTSSSDVIYVNGSSGNDNWDGQSWNTAKLSIKNATGTVNNNGTIHIADWTYTGQNNTNITINKNMTIIGQSQTGTIINGENTNWIFYINPGSNVIIQNLTLTNATGEDITYYGAGITNRGNLTVENCSFAHNSADWGGGAIANRGNLTVTSSTFTDNTGTWAGAIRNDFGTLNVIGCVFTGNTAQENGGAINSDEGTATITDCIFNSNTASQGGAIVNWQNTMNITNCIFTGNNATSYGGAFYNWGATLNAHFNRIYNNTAANGTALYSFSGSVNATKNWWGSNEDPKSINNLITGSVATVAVNPWVILSVNANPTTIQNTKTSTVTADFNHINGGSELTGGHIPEGSITLNVPWGSFTNPTLTHSVTMSTVTGVITATFYANEGAVNPLFNPVRINAIADGYTTNSTEAAYITINKSSNLYLRITSDKTNPQIGETFTLRYKLGNYGPDGADNVVITIPLPEGFVYTNIGGEGWTYNSTTRTITWTSATVPVGDPDLYVTGFFTKAGSYVFSSSISSDTYNINTEGVIPITINVAAEANAASTISTTRTIGMQETGIPMPSLVLAILMVLGGLFRVKRK